MDPITAAATVNDILTAGIAAPFTSRHGDALRTLLRTYAQNGTLDDLGDDLPGRFKTAIVLLDQFTQAVSEAKSSQKYTALGLTERVQTLGAPLFAEAERLDREAATLRDRTTADSERVMADISRPPTTAAEFRAVDSATARLEREDVVIAEAFILEAARRGGTYDAILRAVFTAIDPPLSLSEAHWKPIASKKCMAEARRLVLERLNPLGPLAWRAAILNDLAGALRAAI